MKKIASITILLIATIWVNAQTAEHLKFKNIPIDGSLSAFIQKMETVGFVFDQLEELWATMSGTYDNKPCKLYVIGTPKSKTVWKIIVVYPTHNSWQSLKGEYLEYKNKFTEEYGIPSDEYEFFSSPFNEGDSYELQALQMDKCTYSSFWNLDSGTTSIAIIQSARINLNFEDKINTELKQIEEEDM